MQTHLLMGPRRGGTAGKQAEPHKSGYSPFSRASEDNIRSGSSRPSHRVTASDGGCLQCPGAGALAEDCRQEGVGHVLFDLLKLKSSAASQSGIVAAVSDGRLRACPDACHIFGRLEGTGFQVVFHVSRPAIDCSIADGARARAAKNLAASHVEPLNGPQPNDFEDLEGQATSSAAFWSTPRSVVHGSFSGRSGTATDLCCDSMCRSIFAQNDVHGPECRNWLNHRDGVGAAGGKCM
jgi:hypothetical protein